MYITDDTFRGGRCSNGGALSSISVQWDILNSEFIDNQAIGRGANPASRGTPGGGSGGAIYLDGTDDNVLVAGTVMDGNSAREGGGAVFDVVDTGWGARPSTSHICTSTAAERSRPSTSVYTTSTEMTSPGDDQVLRQLNPGAASGRSGRPA